MLLEYSVNNFNQTLFLPTPKSQDGRWHRSRLCQSYHVHYPAAGFRLTWIPLQCCTNGRDFSILRATCNAKIESDHHTVMNRKPPSQIPQGFTPTPRGNLERQKIYGVRFAVKFQTSISSVGFRYIYRP
ncbi:hypothetical protein ACFX2I_010114 [Malus domestica]